MSVPNNKGQVTQAVKAALAAAFNSPVVEVYEVKPNYLRIRVEQGTGGPRYYNIKVSEEL